MRPAGSDQPVDEPHAKSQLFAPSFCLQAPLQVLVSIEQFRARSLTGFPDFEGIETPRDPAVLLTRQGLTGFPDFEGIETDPRQGRFLRPCLTGFPDFEGIETFPIQRELREEPSDRLP